VAFAGHFYAKAHGLVDRYGPVARANLQADGPLIEQAHGLSRPANR
jgi:hypothetical protein